MEVYLAGENGKQKMLLQLIGGGDGTLSCWKSPREERAEHHNRGGQNMEIYLAGGVQGNLRAEWNEIGTGGLLSTRAEGLRKIAEGEHRLNILESFYYVRKNEQFMSLLPRFENFILDSGCFTFMSDRKTADRIDLNSYTDAYIDFINKYNIKYFVEMDVDSVLGLKKAEELRLRIERGVGRQCIPVWHISRGKQYYLDLVRDYKYVAFGGMITDGKSLAKLEPSFPWFISKAHENDCLLHGLGYTSIDGLHKYHFDSVDSTAWLYGNRGGFLYHFNEQTGYFTKTEAPAGKRLKARDAALWNFNEWVKFQMYARKFL